MQTSDKRPNSTPNLQSAVRKFLLNEAQTFFANGLIGNSLQKALKEKDPEFVSLYQSTIMRLGSERMAKLRAGKLTEADLK